MFCSTCFVCSYVIPVSALVSFTSDLDMSRKLFATMAHQAIAWLLQLNALPALRKNSTATEEVKTRKRYEEKDNCLFF
jgi:hypothetical protein